MDPIFACYMQDCYRIISNGVKEEPTKTQLKVHATKVLPPVLEFKEDMARWHYGYIQFACDMAEKTLSANFKKEDILNLKKYMQVPISRNLFRQPAEGISLMYLSFVANVLNKQWLRRLFFTPNATGFTGEYVTQSDMDSLFAAALVMVHAKRRNVWPIPDEQKVEDWASDIIRRVA